MRWLAAIALAACGGAAVAVGTPAHIVHPTPEGRLAIQQAVSVALQGAMINIDEEALSATGVLVIARTAQLQPHGQMTDGRDPQAPERFHLEMVGEKCVLVQDRTARRTVLNGAQCAPR